MSVIKTHSFPAPAKLNLFLHVTGRRADGYHNLQTVFQLTDLCDTLHFSPRRDKEIRRQSDHANIPAESDLVIRAARALIGDNAPPFGVDVRIDKQIPLGGGLGGGSSDAATTLLALNALWQLDKSAQELAEIGLGLGADVPVFIKGCTAWAEGVGERLTKIAQPARWFVIIHPGPNVETARIFTDPGLTRHTPTITIADFSYAAARNDCEPVVLGLYPEIAEAMSWLRHRSKDARMTGTGASLFAPFASESEARHVAALATQEREMRAAPWRVFVAQGVAESPVLTAIKQLS